MNLIENIQQAFVTHIHSLYSVAPDQLRSHQLTINTDDAKQDFGDLNSNIALVLAKELKRNPRQVAQELSSSFTHQAVAKIEVAGAGFINFYLTTQAWHELTRELSNQKESFFKTASPLKKYDIEFVSANPTGPLHFGHGRSGIIGDVLSSVLRFLGHAVTKEFYINDAGGQIQRLGISFKARCDQQMGIQTPVPEDGYQGDYLIDLAQECVAEYGQSLQNKDEQFFADYAKNKLLERIKNTLLDYGITFDVWFSEKTLHTGKAIEEAIAQLDKAGYLFEQEGALWFRSTAFGDDKDRVLRKGNGQWTYIAADIAYLVNKVQRGFDELAVVLGHDHHSYAVRLQGIRSALQLKPTLDIILYQLVRMKENGELVQMSKRAGTMITLQDVIDAVGKDVARFFYLHRKADAQLEFDLELAKKKTDENPVYYIQYAYVRILSILSKAAQEEGLGSISLDDAQYIGQEESLLLKKIISLKQVLEHIATSQQTHLLAYYAIELADAFHRYYSKHRVVDLTETNRSRGRLLLLTVLKNSFETVLDLLGISKPEKM